MTHPTQDRDLTPEELAAQQAEELPAREAMSVIDPNPLARPIPLDDDYSWTDPGSA